MDQFLAVKAFLQVAESNSFAKAASALELPRNTITKLVQGLEAHLRTKLFNRTTRRVALTKDGSAYYERMTRVMQEWRDADAALMDSSAAPTGRLRVDMGSTMASMFVIPALPDFRQRYPGLVLDLGVGDRPIDLAGDQVECVVRGGVIHDESLVARRIGELNFVTCATPEYLAVHGTPTHPDDLKAGHHELVRYFFAGTGRRLPMEFVRGTERVVIDDGQAVAVNDSNAFLAAGLAGLGIIHTLVFMAREHIDAGRLVPILEDWSTPANPISIVYSPNRHMSRRVRVFVEWMAELFERHRLRI